MKRVSIQSLCTAVAFFTVSIGIPFAQQARTTWKDYLGGSDSSHYSALKQINTENVGKLEVAWHYKTGDDST
jgi:quinoprotein glucose dehydrogenase